jgi:hypothetical protein
MSTAALHQALAGVLCGRCHDPRVLKLHGHGAPRTMRAGLKRLKRLGAGFFRRRWLLRMAREGAERLVPSLKPEIYAVAAALREHRRLSQHEIDAAIALGQSAPDASQNPSLRQI